MDGLTLAAAPVTPVREGSRTGAAVHLWTAAGMLALMVPALLAGHASLAGIAVTFAFFVWAAVVAGWGRGRGGQVARGAVGDPFAMGLLMATPYLGLGLGGHDHGAGTASSASGFGLVVGVLVLVGWAALRWRAAGASRGERFGFWMCLVMMVGMLLGMSVGNPAV